MAIKTYPKGSKEPLSKNFHAYEFDCPCSRCKQTPIDTELVEKLQIMRDLLGAPINPNAYRCPEHNAEIPNAAKASKHMQGMAADITVEGKKPAEVAKCAESVGFKGIGLYDTDKDGHFVHVDTRPTKYFWYGHQQEYRSTFGGTAPAEESTSQSASKPVTTYSSIRLPILMRGSEGDSVKAMQILLKAFGYDLGQAGIDGDFGPATENAVEAFQEDNDLEVDGKFGPKSWGAALGL